jgi:hypothetical protein
MLVSVAALYAPVASAEHFLEQSEDPYKVQFISGNLTASVTKNWPRVDFQHSQNLLSPMFEISIPRLFLFNDTNGDGVFSLSEALYTGLMSDDYVEWTVSAIAFEHSEEAGEYAVTTMSGPISLYKGLVNQTGDEPAVRDWATMTFSFIITENPVKRSNSLGDYVVAGKTDLRITMALSVSKDVGVKGLALEQALKAGGSVYRLLIREQSARSEGAVLTPVSIRDDDRWRGLNYTNRIHQARLPTQDIDFVNEHGLVQAYYRYSSVPATDDAGYSRGVTLNSSYYTTGTSLMLYSVYDMESSADNLTHEMSIGLDMAGFVRVRDWAMQNLPVLTLVVGGLVALTLVSAHGWRRKRRMAAEDGKSLGIEQREIGPETK